MTGDDEPLGQHYNFDTGDLLESTEGWWRARGKSADEASEQLEMLARQADRPFSTNYWGECTEGHTTHDLFRGVIDTWVADLREQAASARNLSSACFGAARTIANADQDSADDIAPL
ncbi:hypothetical protein GII30_15495 [Gordonia amarae]|uniref:Uncharacterized protein n=2 Tax=Gordonia amarae TaxID=36821 RepID=G7GJM0_9ACTN|nr:hypothetical protein [Gordonia amarae]MCS3879811.1 hypothetical protein [Gordonia amarae]QHN18233.1 hypothetical protein GII35_15810 [Gordonia amarae]QHN22717.1 hypothetical protein GII34_15355 [Gordonia amarae]QHN31620.1 hypothetical protein GII32_15660 [Gordonia amarae]QHN40364.1 hypothetical protein GII30_15495 [Gordonia amarae]